MPSETEINDAVQQLTVLFQGKSREDQMTLLAALERGGAAMYRAWAEDEEDQAFKDKLLTAARREEENAEVLEAH
jgi:hypothetical protein